MPGGIPIGNGALADPSCLPPLDTYDPEATIARLVLEEGALRRPLHSYLPIKSAAVPQSIREALLGFDLKRRLVRGAGIPRWPIEPCVEALRAMVLKAAHAAGRTPNPAPFWPDGKSFALILSHDLDSVNAYRRGYWKAFAEIEEAAGLRSAWHFCSEHLEEAAPVLEELSRRGHEVAWQGPRHDYRTAYLDPRRLDAEFAAHRDSLQGMGVRGFRNPNFIRTPALWAGLERAGFGYDTSSRDTAGELFSPLRRQGCCTVFPFFHGRLVELPLTIPDDQTLHCVVGNDAEGIYRIQSAKLDWIREVGGLAFTLTHPERWISMRSGSLKAYAMLVARAARETAAWKPLPRDVEAWWRKRHGVPPPG